MFKKIISIPIKPYGLVSLSLAIGLWFLWSRKIIFAKIFLSFSLMLLLFFSNSFVAYNLSEFLELQYPKYNNVNAEVDYIAVLGNMHNENDFVPLSSSLSDSSTKRVLEAFLIYQKLPKNHKTKIIFSGYSGLENINSNAVMNANLGISLGIKKQDIIVLEEPKNTSEEVRAIAKIINNHNAIIVTSAMHMPRTMLMFRDAKLTSNTKLITAPTDYKTNKYSFYFNVKNLKISQLAFHEYLGIIYLYLLYLF